MTVELVADVHCDTGEHPLWVSDRRELWWTDIPRGRLYRLDEASGSVEVRYRGEPVAAFTQQTDGSLLLFRVTDIARLDGKEQLAILLHHTDPGIDRFNDVIADPEGRVFAGTMARGSQLTAGLLRVDRDGRISTLFYGTAISNGMGFSPDLRRFYWTDTTARTITAFDYDRESGALDNRRVLIEVPSHEGVPDGLAVDTEGCLWSARWGGGAVYQYSPAGKALRRIAVPAAKVAAITFGGDDLRTLYITTGGGKPSEPTLDGAVFRARADVAGMPQFASAILSEAAR